MQTLPGAAETLRRDAVSRTSSGRPAGPMTADPADGAARVALAGLFLALSYRIGLDVVETGRLTGLLLLTSELLVVVLTLVRRTASQVDRRWQVRLIALASIAGPMMVRPSAAGGLLGGPYTLAISLIGLAIVVAGKLSLGRSFGLLPANRGIVSAGIYRCVRHPIYLGYVITHAAFLAAHPTVWNLLALTAADIGLLARARFEERTLRRDAGYRRYRESVRWRMLPGLY